MESNVSKEEKWIQDVILNNFSDDVAIIDDEQKVVTYRELNFAAFRLAKKMCEKTMSTNIILLGNNEIAFVVGLLAIWLNDKTAIFLGNEVSIEDIGFALNIFSADTIVYTDEYSGVVAKTKIKNIIPASVDTAECLLNWQERTWKNKTAIIFQTSGTIQQPKHVIIGHPGILPECKALSEAHGFGKNARELLVVPITSSFGTCGVLLPNLYSGGSVALYKGKLNIRRLANMIKGCRVSIVACTNSILTLLIKEIHRTKEKYEDVEYVISAGEPASLDCLQEAKKVFNAKNVVQCYGLTEASSAISGSVLDYNTPLGSVGKIYPNHKVCIRNNGDMEDNCGEILINGISIMHGYYLNDELNRHAFDNGWFRTGDIGYIDENGYLYVKGRLKNMIIVGGKNVFPEEIEEVLMGHKKVLFAHVYSKEDTVSGEKIVAEIVISDDSTFSALELRRFCKARMKTYMLPKEYIVIKERKINASGKASRLKCEK